MFSVYLFSNHITMTVFKVGTLLYSQEALHINTTKSFNMVVDSTELEKGTHRPSLNRTPLLEYLCTFRNLTIVRNTIS